MAILKTYSRIDFNSIKLSIEIDSSGAIENFEKFTIGEELKVFGTNLLDEALLDSIIENHVAIDPVQAERKRIDKREVDGLNAYKNTQALLRYQRLQNNISDVIYTQYVYGPLDGLITKVRSGNWLDAYNTVDAIQTNDYLSAAMLLNFKNQIANYIVGEGDYTEYTGRTVDPLTGIIS